MIGVTAVLGTAGGAYAATGARSYGPPAPPVSPAPGGFTAVVTTVTVGPAGGTVGPVDVDGTSTTVTVPAGAFPATVTVTLTAPDLAAITPVGGDSVVNGVGILVDLNGSPYPGTFLKPLTATLDDSKITAASVVVVWNGAAFVTDPDSTDASGVSTVSFDTDPDFAVETPVSAPPTPVPTATVPVTGEPFLGAGIAAGVLILGGAGGILLSRRRRARA